MATRRRKDARRSAAPVASPAPARAPARPWRRPLVLVLAGAVLVAGGLASWRLARGPCARPDVLLVTIDTLRADHVGCYGSRRAATPVLDALAARGVRFETAIAPTPLTAPSHASILTGLTPLRHGVRDNGGFALPEGIGTLAEALRASGYRTAAFVSGFPLDRRFGLARGFDLYDDRLPRGTDARRAAYVERPADQTTDALLRWLDGEASAAAAAAAPRFAWVHYFDPHAPYEPPPAFAERFRGAPYDGEIAFVDAQLGRVLDHLRARGVLERTLVLATADHGESLGEHGEPTHGVFIYDATQRVPLILAGPGVPARGVATTVARSLDVAPTLLDLAGLGVPDAMEGRSLRRAARGESLPDAPAYLESLFAHLQLGFAPLHGWRTAEWKLIEAPRPELYGLSNDPGETRDRHAGEAARAERLTRELRAALLVKPPVARAAAGGDAAERLRALGYLGGGDAPAARGARRDPKDGLALLLRVERGVAEAQADPALAIRELSAALAEEPGLTLARRYRAIALARAGDARAALADLDALVREGAAGADDLVLRGECLRRAGRAGEARQALLEAQRLAPLAPEAALARAQLAAAEGRADEAEAAFEEALKRRPGHRAARAGMAELALGRGDLARADALYRGLLEDEPDDPRALVRLGTISARSGRLEDAVPLFARAVQLEPDSAEALLGLAGALARSRRPDQAVPYFERAIATGAAGSAAYNGLGFARLEAGDARGALQALRASLRLDPSQPEIAAAAAEIARRERGSGR
jgi:arylsulfatase A-like enzyme/tetratricopeptide (TPR) repeat protein